MTVSINGTTGIELPSGTASATTQLQNFRNRIINGNMLIDQRQAGAAITYTAGGVLGYTIDRWYAWCTGANITGQQITLANGQKRFRNTGAASNTGVGFAQRIEAVNSLDLAGSSAALSIKLSSSSLTSITWAVYYANTTNDFGSLAAPTRTQIATGTFTINATEATYSAIISIPSAAITGIEVVFTSGALLASQTLTFGDAQFEPGNQVTPFQFYDYSAALRLCMPYTQAVGSSFYGATEGTTAFALQIPLTVRLRNAPTNINVITGKYFSCRYSGGDVQTLNPTIANQTGTDSNIWLQVTTSGRTANLPIMGRSLNSGASDFILADAEMYT